MDNKKITLKKIPGGGKGIVAKAPIKKNEIIADFDGPVYHWHSKWTNNLADHVIQFAPRSWRASKGLAKYINHSCEPNCGVLCLFTIVAMRNIKTGEQLTWDYEMTDNNISRYWSMKCHCGTKSCRKVIGAYRHMPPQIRRKYQGYISPWLLLHNIPYEKRT